MGLLGTPDADADNTVLGDSAGNPLAAGEKFASVVANLMKLSWRSISDEKTVAGLHVTQWIFAIVGPGRGDARLDFDFGGKTVCHGAL